MSDITEITITSRSEWQEFAEVNSDAFTADELDCILIDAMTETGALVGGGAAEAFRVFFRA